MTMNSPKGLSGVMAVPRSRSSIVVVIGAMVLFLVAASFLLASYPFAVSTQQYLQEEGHVVVEEVKVWDGDNPSKGGGTGDGPAVESGSGSGDRMDDRLEVKSGLVSDTSKDVGIGDGSAVNTGSVMDERSIDGRVDESGAKIGSEFKTELSSDGRKDVGFEVKDGSDGNKAVSGTDISSNGSDSTLYGGKSNVVSDGSVSLDRNGENDIDKGNLASGLENESLKAISGNSDDGSALIDDAKEVPVILSESGNNSSAAETCDLYQGKWIYDPAGPLYTNNTCPVLTQMQNCQGNLRPDKDYENYRWKPDQCDLPRFDPRKFLELMRGKTLAFIGDSVARNQMESMLCILWQEETPKNRGNRRMQRWFFRSTSTMIVRIWSSWLVHQDADPIDFAPPGLTKVHLDIPDETFMEFLPQFDIVVLSSGHWFAKKSAYILNNKVIGGQLWWPKNKNMNINNVDAFGISVETSMNAIANDPNFKGIAIIRSYSPDHYEGGTWNTGGSCTGKIRPLNEVVRNGFTDVMHEKQITGFKNAVEKSGNGGGKLRMMDITEVFGYRADGHPGPYRNPDPNKKTKRGPHGEPPPQDCLHWCMPGPVDTWNEMLLEIIRREYERA